MRPGYGPHCARWLDNFDQFGCGRPSSLCVAAVGECMASPRLGPFCTIEGSCTRMGRGFCLQMEFASPGACSVRLAVPAPYQCLVKSSHILQPAVGLVHSPLHRRLMNRQHAAGLFEPDRIKKRKRKRGYAGKVAAAGNGCACMSPCPHPSP